MSSSLPLRATARVLELPAVAVEAPTDGPIEGPAPHPPCGEEALGGVPPPTRSITNPDLFVSSVTRAPRVALALAAAAPAEAAAAAFATPGSVGCSDMKAVAPVSSLLLAGDMSSQGRLGRAAMWQTPAPDVLLLLLLLLSSAAAPVSLCLPLSAEGVPPRAVLSKSDPEGYEGACWDCISILLPCRGKSGEVSVLCAV